MKGKLKKGIFRRLVMPNNQTVISSVKSEEIKFRKIKLPVSLKQAPNARPVSSELNEKVPFSIRVEFNRHTLASNKVNKTEMSPLKPQQGSINEAANKTNANNLSIEKNTCPYDPAIALINFVTGVFNGNLKFKIFKMCGHHFFSFNAFDIFLPANKFCLVISINQNYSRPK